MDRKLKKVQYLNQITSARVHDLMLLDQNTGEKKKTLKDFGFNQYGERKFFHEVDPLDLKLKHNQLAVQSKQIELLNEQIHSLSNKASSNKAQYDNQVFQMLTDRIPTTDKRLKFVRRMSKLLFLGKPVRNSELAKCIDSKLTESDSNSKKYKKRIYTRIKTIRKYIKTTKYTIKRIEKPFFGYQLSSYTRSS